MNSTTQDNSLIQTSLPDEFGIILMALGQPVGWLNIKP
jgi:hypothetical protein